jgi:DNA modification methylase
MTRIEHIGDATLYLGDCLEILPTLGKVDAVVTDPPYGLAFMGKKWDYDVPSQDVWAECLRVLKPGGHLLAFAGTRTQHRMTVRIEDAGFEIRDMIAWVYGSGFPKSHNLKDEWQGWGTALKPALEPITVARKPLAGTVAANVLAHGTGAINVDGCRVEGAPPSVPQPKLGARERVKYGFGTGIGRNGEMSQASGRWPANLIHDGSDEVVAGFPASVARPVKPEKIGVSGSGEKRGMFGQGSVVQSGHYDTETSAARFFYCAKASKKDRDEGLDTAPKPFVQFQTANGTSGKPSSLSEGRNTEYRNTHPTVKPTELMRYLCRLVTPPGGVVLDPFMGSGSTGKAAVLEGFRFIGIEREPSYFDIACRRIEAAYKQPDLFISKPEPAKQEALL